MKKLAFLMMLVVSLFIITGCGDKPSGDPKIVFEQYNQSFIDGNYDAAYNLLSSHNQAEVSLEEFKDWCTTNDQLGKTNSFSIIGEEELADYTYDGKSYPYAIRYKVSHKDYDYITEKDYTSESEKIIVAEDKEWKVLSEESYRIKYARAVGYLGWAYREGKSVDVDINGAISLFLRAIEIEPDYADTYYDIAYAYSSKNQYEKALQYVDIGIEKEKNEIALSNLYNMKGTILEQEYDFEGAKKAYLKALELDPNNVYATDNLELLESE